MPCEMCTDPDGEGCFPVYGVGPHTHTTFGANSFATVHLPPEQWPSNYQEDPDCPGCGTWWCPNCGDGKPEGAAEPAKTGGA